MQIKKIIFSNQNDPIMIFHWDVSVIIVFLNFEINTLKYYFIFFTFTIFVW